MDKYRIIESVGKFHIEISYKKRTRDKEEWRPLDVDGRPMLSPLYQQRLGKFDDLESAKKVVDSIKRGKVIHEI